MAKGRTHWQKVQATRLHLRTVAYWGLSKAPLHYSQARPMHFGAFPPNPSDCSYFVTAIYHQCFQPDPNGNNYNGYGFTGTLQQHGKRVYIPALGDLVFWGNPDHVGIVVEVPRIRQLGLFLWKVQEISHGHEGGPSKAGIWYRGRPTQVRRYVW